MRLDPYSYEHHSLLPYIPYLVQKTNSPKRMTFDNPKAPLCVQGNSARCRDLHSCASFLY